MDDAAATGIDGDVDLFSRGRRYAIFAIVSIALFMSSVDLTVVATALPTIGHDLGGSRLNWTSWIITSYSLARVVTAPLIGRTSEVLGTRTIFVAAVALFTVSSLLCGIVNDLPTLVVLRAVQGVGGAAFVPSASGLVADTFGPNRDRALGLFSSIVPIGAIIGPVLGGIIVNYWSWRGVFLVNVPIGIVIVALGLRLVPDVRRPPSADFDLAGAVLLCLAMLGAALTITYLGDAGHHLDDPLFVALLAATLLTSATLVLRRNRGRTAPRPRHPGRDGFAVMNVINFLYGAAALGLAALVPVYAQVRYGMDSLAAGTLLTARGIGTIAVAGAATFALRRTGYRLPMVAGYSLAAVGLAVLAIRAPADVSAHLWLSLSALVVGVGMGLALPASNNASMQLDPTRITTITSLRVTLRQLGSIVAISGTTALMSRSTSPGTTEAWVFVGFAVVLAAVVPLAWLVPEHKAGW